MDSGIEAAKAALRQEARSKRAAMHSEQREEASRSVAAHFLVGVRLAPGDVVAGYWPIREELDCKPILTRLMDSGQPVCLPVVVGDGQPLALRLWRDGEALYPAGLGTLAPEEGAPLVEPDVVLMPLLGFDRSGTRLGYGGGYYDRTLAALGKRPLLVGLAFAGQALDIVIPREPHDVPLDLVVTEDGVTRFALADAAQ
jgi:5-formyltetrahydrofolate cyclo-ligase